MHFLSSKTKDRLRLAGNPSLHTGKMWRWCQDDSITYYLFAGRVPGTRLALEEQMEAEQNAKDTVLLGIWWGDDFIGTTAFYSIEPISRTAEFRIFIGEKKLWGQGIGITVTRMMTHYGFDRLNMHTIWLGVNAEHHHARNCYAKAGFKLDGVLRQMFYRNSRYYDVVRMSILRGEWAANKEFYEDA